MGKTSTDQARELRMGPRWKLAELGYGRGKDVYRMEGLPIPISNL